MIAAEGRPTARPLYAHNVEGLTGGDLDEGEFHLDAVRPCRLRLTSIGGCRNPDRSYGRLQCTFAQSLPLRLHRSGQ